MYLSLLVVVIVFAIVFLLFLNSKESRKSLIRERGLVKSGCCNICEEKYVGLANDCKCTNWGKTI